MSSTTIGIGPAEDASAVASEVLQRIRAVVLLGGSLGNQAFRGAVARPLLELPVSQEHGLLDLWQRSAGELAERAGLGAMPIRLLVDQAMKHPPQPREDGVVPVVVDRDPIAFRGTGGLLSDICGDYDADDFIVVGNANQVLLEPLPELVSALAARRSPIAIVVHADGTPGAVLLLRVGVLRDVASVGFVDLKEQALPKLAETHATAVVRREEETCLPVRDLPSYLEALRRWHQSRDRVDVGPWRPAFAERWSSAFTIIEDGAIVDPSAVLQDAVVLRGAVVYENAVVARSLIGERAVVRPNGRVVDHVLRPLSGAVRGTER